MLEKRSHVFVGHWLAKCLATFPVICIVRVRTLRSLVLEERVVLFCKLLKQNLLGRLQRRDRPEDWALAQRVRAQDLTEQGMPTKQPVSVAFFAALILFDARNIGTHRRICRLCLLVVRDGFCLHVPPRALVSDAKEIARLPFKKAPRRFMAWAGLLTKGNDGIERSSCCSAIALSGSALAAADLLVVSCQSSA